MNSKKSVLNLQSDSFLGLLLQWRVEQIKLSSKTWISLAIMSIYTIASLSEGQAGKLELPFIKVSLPKDYFILISSGFIAAFSVRWLEAENRSINLFQKIIKGFYCSFEFSTIKNTNFRTQDLIDYLCIPNTTAVWSGPAALADSKNSRLRLLSLPYLIFLKALSTLIHFGLPVSATYFILFQVFPIDSVIDAITLFFVFIATIVLLQGIANNFLYMKESVINMKNILNQIKPEDTELMASKIDTEPQI